MIVSVNWLKKFTDINYPIEELATLIGARLVEIEDVIGARDKYEQVIIIKVVSCQSMSDSDHLQVVKIDDGGIAKNVERDEAGFIQVVCGAQNVRVGVVTAWLPPESFIPESLKNTEHTMISVRSIHGVSSSGMLASPKELALFDDHAGIIELEQHIKPGASFIDVYELDDHLLDIENKSLTHRPDVFGIIGFAREVSAIQGENFRSPEWFINHGSTISEPNEPIALTVEIADAKLSERYQAIVLGQNGIGTTEFGNVQSYLARCGVRPISPIVDITNYIMLLTGQPLHAFDYDKFLALNNGNAEVVVRAARDGEVLKLLDGRTIKLSDEDIVVCSGNTPAALAGAMGGAATEISSSTQRILLESATFNLYKLRSTQMRHGIFSEAITRFTKGQSAKLTTPALKKAVEMLGETVGTQILSRVEEAYPNPRPIQTIDLSINRLNNILGSGFEAKDIIDILRRVEFSVEETSSSDVLRIDIPYWRADVVIDEDLIEEVGRISGFDNIVPTLPSRDFTAVYPSAFDRFRTKLGNALVRTGANELLTYSFVHGDTIKRAVQDSEKAFRITNAISPDLQYYRLSLTPSLLQKISINTRQGYEQFAIFEIGKVHHKGVMAASEPTVPAEVPSIAYVVAANKKAAFDRGSAYYQAKHALKQLLSDTLYAKFRIAPLHTTKDDFADSQMARPFESKRGGIVYIDNEPVGLIGEYKRSIVKDFKLPDYVAGFELDIQKVYELTRKLKMEYSPLSRYPGTEQDVCVRVDNDLSFEAVVEVFERVLEQTELEWQLLPHDIYMPKDGSYKNVTLRVRLVSNTHTLTTQEANKIVSDIGKSAVAELNAQII